MVEILENSRHNFSLTKNRSKYYHSFIKWAGGKSRLIQQIQYFLPEHFNNYFEPFVGSGALFFLSCENGKN